MDTVEGWQATKQGSPQGAVISRCCHLSYLHGLDWKMARKALNGPDTLRLRRPCYELSKSRKSRWRDQPVM